MKDPIQKRKDSFRKKLEKMNEAGRRVIFRDHGCVFCHMNYRPEDHIPLPDYDWHFFSKTRADRKMFAACDYHAYVLSHGDKKQREEMRQILEDYLKDKEDPEVF